MIAILKNIWVQRAIAVFNLIYIAIIAFLVYATFLYTFVINNGKTNAFLGVFIAANVIFLATLVLTRRNVLTKINAVILLPLVFFLIILNMGQWALIIPPFIVAVVVFFVSGLHETAKVVVGTIYLLVYVLGLMALLVLNYLMGGSSVETRLDASLDQSSAVYSMYDMSWALNYYTDAVTVSPDGTMKFYFADVKNSENGQIKIYVEPYNRDKKFRFFTLKEKGIRSTIKFYNTRGGDLPIVQWTADNKIQYRMPDEADFKTTTPRLPEKDYFGFLGI
ncbi:MAG: hypothetical protein QM689_01915 [Oscillospiraceae bacterium]